MEKLDHFRRIILFEFIRGAKAEEEARNICAVYGDNVIGKNTARTQEESGFLVLTLVTLQVQEDHRGLMFV